MNVRPASPASSRSPSTKLRDSLGGSGRPAPRTNGVWELWLRLTVPPPNAGMAPARQREYGRRARLLSALQMTAIILIALLLPRGFLPVIDPGTLIGIVGFAVLVIASIVVCRLGNVTTGSAIFVIGLAAAIAGSQLFTPSGKIDFEDLAGYDIFVVPILITGILLPRAASIWMWLCCASFVVIDLGLAEHGASLDAYLPKLSSPFLSIYPVAIYPLIITAVIAVISWLAAGSVARALEDADRTAGLEQANRVISAQKAELEGAIAQFQQVHSRIANGDLSARAATTSGNLLLPIAISLNLMLERLVHTTASQNLLEGQEQQIARLSHYTAMLAQGKLDRPLPHHNMGSLTTIAVHLEQLRAGMVQVTQYSFSLTAQIDSAQTEARTQVLRLEEYPQASSEIAPVLLQKVDASQLLTKTLQQYLRRFGAA